MRRWGRVLLVSMVISLCGASCLCAQGTPGQGGQPAMKMPCQDRFDLMDKNKDGTLTREEFMEAKHPGGRAEEVFKSKDTDGNGALTKQEFCTGGRKGKGKGMGTGTGTGGQNQ